MKDGGVRPPCLLGIYTADGVAAAAVYGEREAAAEAEPGLGALEALLPCVRRALSAVGSRLEDVTSIGVCTGPGSFTGLRIGVAFARSLAQARSVSIVGISTYDAVAEGDAYPRVAVARGKPGFYYARLLTAQGAPPQYVAGPRTVVEEAARRAGAVDVVGPDFSAHTAAAAALRVARRAGQAQESGARCSWAEVKIDYGQRPQAVLQCEERRRVPAGG